MSVESFKKEIWETALIEEYSRISLVEVITTPPSSVEGKTAHFNIIGDVTVDDYDESNPNLTWEGLSTTGIDLTYDKKKKFNFSVKDVDKVQIAGELMQPALRTASEKLKKTIDTDVFNEIVDGFTVKIGNKTTDKKTISTPEEAYDYIVDLGTELDNNDVPEDGRYVCAKPEFVNLLAKDKRVLDNTQVLPNGVVQGMLVNGMQICKSNNVPTGVVIATNKLATGFGKQIDEIEALRLQNDFADGVRGLTVYGQKTLRPKSSAILYYTIA